MTRIEKVVEILARYGREVEAQKKEGVTGTGQSDPVTPRKDQPAKSRRQG